MGAVSRMSSYWEVVRQYFGKTEPNKEHSNDQESDKQRYDYYNNEEQTSILYLPEDILLLILQYLPPKDLISLERACSLIRGLIVQYNVYRTRFSDLRDLTTTWLYQKLLVERKLQKMSVDIT